MLFSVITVTYKDAPGLTKTRDSVLSQEFPDFEWIVIDGGSSPRSLGILNEINDTRLTWISESDSGIFNAMNKGLRISTGEYCIFMNGGDCFASTDVLRKVAERISTEHFHGPVVYGDSFERDDDRLLNKPARRTFANHYSMFTHHQSIFYSRAALDEGYDESYKYSSDWALTTRILRSAGYHSLYLQFPVCIFERGGISQRDDVRAVINREHWRILRKEAGLGVFFAGVLWTLKTRSNWIRSRFPVFYDNIRFWRK